MRCAALFSSILLSTLAGSLTGQDFAARSHADLAREADSIRAAYRDSVARAQVALAREADSIRAAYRDSIVRSQAALAREADSIRAAYRDSVASASGSPKSGLSRAPVYRANARPTAAVGGPRFIRGFAGVPWGSSAADVIARKGKPLSRTEESNGSYLGYRESLLGYNALALYLLSKTLGLVKGAYSVKFSPGSGCERVYSELVQAIKAKYPEMEPTEAKYNNSTLDFCDGVMIGEAGATTIWRDPYDSTAMIGVGLSPGAKNIQIQYESPAFEGWAAAQKRLDEGL
jgi:hypothetical protein